MQLLKLRLTGLLSLTEGHTLDSTQEFGGPDESRYPLDNGPGGEGSTISQDSASGTLQYKNVSEGSSLIDNDGNRTIHTS